MNISGTVNVFRLIRDPALCLPQHTVSTFNHLPIPLSSAFPKRDGKKDVDIKAVVLDKDNCFAIPHTNEVHKPYNVKTLSSFSLQFTHGCSSYNRHQSLLSANILESQYLNLKLCTNGFHR